MQMVLPCCHAPADRPPMVGASRRESCMRCGHLPSSFQAWQPRQAAHVAQRVCRPATPPTLLPPPQPPNPHLHFTCTGAPRPAAWEGSTCGGPRSCAPCVCCVWASSAASSAPCTSGTPWGAMPAPQPCPPPWPHAPGLAAQGLDQAPAFGLPALGLLPSRACGAADCLLCPALPTPAMSGSS